MNRTIYATLIALRDAAWGDRGMELEPENPSTDAEQFWYHQGRAEAFAEVMTLMEREA